MKKNMVQSFTSSVWPVPALIFTGCATNRLVRDRGAACNAGHMIITRSQIFERSQLVVSVDGKDVGSFTEGRQYSGYLPAGQHVIVARADPNRESTRPGESRDCKSWTDHSYTAACSGGKFGFSKKPLENAGTSFLP